MKLICPECKNSIDTAKYPDIAVGYVIECPMCGITLGVDSISESEIKVSIVDEGK